MKCIFSSYFNRIIVKTQIPDYSINSTATLCTISLLLSAQYTTPIAIDQNPRGTFSLTISASVQG